MIGETYNLKPDENFEVFEFESVGLQGRISKVIVFSFYYENTWNLGFGDQKMDGNNWDDKVVSNNGDLVRVISTVAKAVYDFSDKWPNRQILIVPVDERRKKLYNRVFQKHVQEIPPEFEVLGFRNQKLQDYSPILFFDWFLLSRKKD